MVQQIYEKVSSGKGFAKDPRKDASILSNLTFWWMNEVFQKGNKRSLDESDFLPLQDEDDEQQLTETIEERWQDERARCKISGRQARFWRAVLKVVNLQQLAAVVLAGLVSSMCRLLKPVLLGFLVLDLMLVTDGQRSYLYLYAAALFLATLVDSLAGHCYYYHTYVMGVRLRAGLKGLVYHKIFRLGQQTLRKFTMGQVIDLVSNDVQRMYEAPPVFIRVWLSLLDIVVAAILMCYFVGFQTLVGLAFLVLLVPIYVCLSLVTGKLRKKTASASDRRILLVHEVLLAIRAIKTNAWEWVYRDKMSEIRREELGAIRQKFVVLSVMGGLLLTSGSVATFISVIVMAITGNLLTPSNVFMLMAVMNILRSAVSFCIAFGLQSVVEAYVSLGRIQDFLMLETLPHISEDRDVEDDRQVSSGKPDDASKIGIGGDVALPQDQKLLGSTLSKQGDLSLKASECEESCIISNLTFNTNDNNGKYILWDVSFEATHGSLMVISGPVGSGKSSLLSAIIKENPVSAGSILCPENIAYVSQTPWVFFGTIRENIQFGKDFDEEKYAIILEACALKRDIDRFPDGDQTIVGERGVVLSGGQQMRVNLARAVYADADLYLLDDPLSAVDASVSAHIFQNCICKLLASKTRLLVTHQVSHLKMADKIVLLCKGQLLCQGSYLELTESGKLADVLDNVKQASIPAGESLEIALEEEIVSIENGALEESEKCSDSIPQGLSPPEEDRTVGTVSLKLYWEYFRASVSHVTMVGVVLVFVVTQVLLVLTDVWLSHLVKEPQEEQHNSINMVIYTALSGAALAFAIGRVFLFYSISLQSSAELYQKMTVAVLKAPVLFFDVNPTGRILNRFSKDVGSMDEELPKCFVTGIQMLSSVIASAVLPVLFNFWLFLGAVPIVVAFMYTGRYYLKSSRELKRLESICRSPVFSHISETLNGLDTIRSRRRQADFIQQFYRCQNKLNQVSVMNVASIRWMAVRVEALGALFIGITVLLSIHLMRDAALAGLSMVYAINILSSLQYGMQQLANVENNMTSVERVMTYTEIESEPGYDNVKMPPNAWPHDPNIALNDVSLRYYPEGPLALRKLNVIIERKSKIGVAGRTGAGKSSLIAALLRMPDAEGSITIDGVDLAAINLQESRRCMSVLSQKPVLFSGPLRKNLDPIGKHDDADLWRVLEEVQLKFLVEHLDNQLDYNVSEAGGNFSVGERQLLCLARILLQQNTVFILDEPTAHVDPITEKIIQTTVRNQLQECTVITVAHRLSTIRDCDKILVMEDGSAVEFDSYDELMKKENGIFAQIARKQH